ncbi:MAG: HlyD family efflux transporter periplasmic adaptor subunit [Planctomycetales bacterium]|nr:HlyD family efflux transporter periplasmic adaptor subunit [Planctomycetales bacterium]
MWILAAVCSGPFAEAQTIDVDSVLIRLIDQVDVPARALGSLEEIYVVEGAVVTRDQPLAQIDATEARLAQQLAQFEVAIAQHHAGNDIAMRSATKTRDFAQEDYERLFRANKEQPRSVSLSELEKARLQAEQASLEVERATSELEVARIQANLAASEFELAKRNVAVRSITAPSPGVVVSVLYRVGEWVTPGDKIFRIVRTDRLRAEGFVTASDVVSDLRGASVTLTLDPPDAAGMTFSGKVVFVSPEIDPLNGQVRVWADVENPSGRLRPGLRAKMSIAHRGTPR